MGLVAGLFFFILLFFLPNHPYFYFPFEPDSVTNKIKEVPPAPRPKIEVGSFKNPAFPISSLSAKSFLVIDFDSGKIIIANHPDLALPPASLTKLLTALVAVEYYQLDDVLEVDKEYRIGKNMGLVVGERIKVFDLLLGLLIHSANDAAYVLARNYPGGERAFIKRMNQKAREIGLRRSNFVNFDGEEDLGHYSTPWDLAQLARVFLKDPVFKGIVQMKRKTVFSADKRFVHQLENTNELLGKIWENKGVKTGWTQEAGECFIGYFEFDGRRIITVVLKSKNRFEDTKTLFEWVKENVRWQDYSLIHSGEIAETNP